MKSCFNDIRIMYITFRFMCELLRANILKPPVLEMCVTELVEHPKDVPLECACVFLQHVRSTINHVRFTNVCHISYISLVSLRYYNYRY